MLKTLLSFISTVYCAKVIKLTDDNFDQLVYSRLEKISANQNGNGYFVKFFAPSCIHCKKMAPIWEKFAEEYGDKINVAEVDCSV